MPIIFNKPLHKLVKYLLESQQIQQRTEEWFHARRSALTASEISNALEQCNATCKSYIDCVNPSFRIRPKVTCGYSPTKTSRACTRIKKLIQDKAFPENVPRMSNKFTNWGERFEPIASAVYAQKNETDVHDLGLIVHPEYDFLAASPDGITSEARLIEIKCPRNRNIEEPIPLYYYHQMLLQMECTGCEECDFVDCEFVEYIDRAQWISEGLEYTRNNPLQKFITFGILFEYINPLKSNKIDRIYPPWNLFKLVDIIDWYETYQDEDEDYKPVFYKLEKIRITRIKRDEEWIPNNIESFTNVWNQIKVLRTKGVEKATEGELVSLSSSNTHTKRVNFDTTTTTTSPPQQHASKKRKRCTITKPLTTRCLI